MESSDDEGEQAAPARFAMPVLFLLLLLPASIHKQSLHSSPIKMKPPGEKKEAPPATVKKKKPKKKLYLTFDDGPNKGTANVLHITRDEGAPVTFFIVGEHVFASDRQSATWDSLKIAEHIGLCNHSFSHGWHNRYNRFYDHPDSVVKDFSKTHDTLDLDNPIVRTPGRNVWRIDSIQFTDLKKTTAAADSLYKAGFVIMGWDLEWHYDHRTMSVTTSADKLMEQIDSVFAKNKTRLPGHLVLLAHDQVYAKSSDSFQLRQFLQLLRKKEEYELVLAMDYPGALNDSLR